MRLLERASFAVVLPLVLLGLVGCGGDQVATYEPITDPTQLYMSLTLNHGAITMATGAPYNTLQLTGTPRDALGTPIEGLPAPTFTSTDTTSLQVSPEGMLTARQPASGILVIADLVAPGNVRHADTAIVNVTSEPPSSALTTFSMHPVAPDSAIVPLAETYDARVFISALAFRYSGYLTVWDLAPRVRALDATENPMPGLNIEYLSLDPLVATVDRRSGLVRTLRPGQTRMVARTMAYGMAKADTVVFTVTPPAMTAISIEPRSGGMSIFGSVRRIRPNGLVYWANWLNRPVDIVYDNPTNVAAAPELFCNVLISFLGPGPSCSAGDITVPQPADTTFVPFMRTQRVQQFTAPGIYNFHDPQSGATGRIIVTMDDTNE